MVWTAPKTYSTGAVLTAAELNTYQRDNFEAQFPDGATTATYTPALTAVTTNPTLGSGSTQSGRYWQVGKLVTCWIRVGFGTSGTAAGSGAYRVSLPVTADTTQSSAAVGSVSLFDSSGTAFRVGTARIQTGSTVAMVTNSGIVSNSTPWTWAASDVIQLQLSYEAA